MPGQSKVNGIWRTTTGLSVKVSGSWKTATGAFIKVGGQWKQWFASKIQDAFNRASTSSGLGIAESGQAWNSLRGNWRISGSQTAVSDDAASSYALSTINLGSPNVNVNMDVSGGVGPAFWVTDSGSWWGSYVRYNSSPTTVSVCNGGYAECGGAGCNPGNCCSGISTSSYSVCNGGPVSTCNGSGCQPAGCCGGVSYSGGTSYCSDYRTNQPSGSGCVGECTSSQSGGGTSCTGYGNYASRGSCNESCGVSVVYGSFVCDRFYAESQSGYPSSCCGGYGTYNETRVISTSCNYNISGCVGYNCTPSGCCPGEGYILRNYYANGKYYTDCYSGVSTQYGTVTIYYCYTGGSYGADTYNCYTGIQNNPVVTTYSGCWGYSTTAIQGSCYTTVNSYTTRSCYTSTTNVPATNYVTDVVIFSYMSGNVVTESTVNISNNNSSFTQVGSMFLSTVGNSVTAKAYSGAAQSGQELATATANPSNPTKGTSVGILKAPSTGSQGSTADSFLATLNI